MLFDRNKKHNRKRQRECEAVTNGQKNPRSVKRDQENPQAAARHKTAERERERESLLPTGDALDTNLSM